MRIFYLKKYFAPLVIILLWLAIDQDLAAQKEKPMNKSWYDDKLFHFGFSLGTNTMDFRITPSQLNYSTDSIYAEVSHLFPGINIQIITDLRLNKYMNLRFLPGVSFGQRTIMYYLGQESWGGEQRLESSFLEFPLSLKFKGDRMNNVRPYIIGGLNYRYDLSGKKEFNDEKPVYVRLKRPDLYYEAGAGIDFYLTYFKLGVELKMSNGMANVLIDDYPPNYPEYRNAIDKMRSQIWVMSFHFE